VTSLTDGAATQASVDSIHYTGNGNKHTLPVGSASGVNLALFEFFMCAVALLSLVSRLCR